MRGLTHFSILDDNQPQASAEKDSRSSMRGEVTARPPPTAAVADAATAGTNSTPFNLGRHKRRICTKLLTTKMTCGQPTGISYSTGDKKIPPPPPSPYTLPPARACHPGHPPFHIHLIYRYRPPLPENPPFPAYPPPCWYPSPGRTGMGTGVQASWVCPPSEQHILKKMKSQQLSVPSHS